MEQREKLIYLIYRAIDEVNQLLPSERHLEKTLETILLNNSFQGSLDSLGMVNFIVALEQLIQEELGISVSVADDLIISKTQNPFESVAVLADNLDILLRTNDQLISRCPRNC